MINVGADQSTWIGATISQQLGKAGKHLEQNIDIY
jgi:hypothetical protein